MSANDENDAPQFRRGFDGDRCGGDAAEPLRPRGGIRLQDGSLESRRASVPQAAARSLGPHREGNRRAHDAYDFPGEPARRRQRSVVASAQRRGRLRPARRPDPRLDLAGCRRQRHGLRIQGLSPGVDRDRRRARRLCPRADRRQGGARADGEALGSGLPPDHDLHQADREGCRPRRPEAAGPRRARAGVAVHRARRISCQHAVRRGLYVAADQGRRRAGESAVGDRRRASSTRCRNTAPSPTTSGTATGSAPIPIPGTGCRTTSRRSSRRRSTKLRCSSATTSPSSTARCRPSSRKRVSRSPSPTSTSFRDKLRTAGFYQEWRGKVGNEAWVLLEKYVGKLG